MEYNKDSFLAGIAVGRRLKGWSGGKADAGGGSSPSSGVGMGIIFDKDYVRVYDGKVIGLTEIVHEQYNKEE